jgi:outer membrane protein
MRRLKRAVALAIGSIWLAGCATSAVDMAPERPDQPWNPATTATGEIIPGAKAPPDSSGPGYTLPSNAEVATVPPPPPGVDLRRAYTLPELIDIAQMNNPLTRTAWNDARKVALTAGIAESTYLPRISASAAGAYLTSQGNGSTTATGGPLAVGTNTGSNSSAQGTISAVSLQWLLFDFGAREAVIDAAKQASVISNITFTAAHQQVISDVSAAFYANAAARGRAATAAESLKNAQAVEAAADDRYKNSIGTVVEVSQAHQATAQAR